MIKTDTQTNAVIQADIIALDALFNRIAERGRKIRSQNNTSDGDNPGKDALSAVLDTNSQGKEFNHG